MYPTKKNVLQLVALLKAHYIKHIVLSPGSRNAPLIQAFSQDSDFDCHVIVDERNAGFYALGIIQATKEPVVICCTSGTALMNYAPAVAEAYYQQLPLIVISADRSQAWIGQMDGQTVPQVNVFSAMVRKSVNLPEINTEQEEWYCNRLINEAIIACANPAPSPVHINIPISEPLFDYSEKNLPLVRKIHHTSGIKHIDLAKSDFALLFRESPKRMIVIGQLLEITQEQRILMKELAVRHNCVILCEHLSNCEVEHTINNFDPIIYTLSDDEKETYSPDLLIAFGGHIVSKRLKQFIRANQPEFHWHLSPEGEIVDLYQGLTDVIETDIEDFLFQLAELDVNTEFASEYYDLWQTKSATIQEPNDNIPFSDISATRDFIKALPIGSNLHLANSSAVRNAQLFNLDPSTQVYCNRGTNGIESSLPSAIGFASVTNQPTYLVIGDLSFFYSIGSLWNIQHIKNLRILLLNNNCGGIFHLLPGLKKAPSLQKYVGAEHSSDAEKWAEASQLKYLTATNQEELNKALTIFTSDSLNQSVILEVKVDIKNCKEVMKSYYHNLENN